MRRQARHSLTSDNDVEIGAMSAPLVQYEVRDPLRLEGLRGLQILYLYRINHLSKYVVRDRQLTSSLRYALHARRAEM